MKICNGSSCAPCDVSIASMNGLVAPCTCPDSSKIAKTGDKPCAVVPSAARALYSVFKESPTIFFCDGTMRVTADSSGESCIILAARLKTNAA